jgi:transposase
MATRKLRLGLPEAAADIDKRHAAEPDGWRKNRLLAVKLAARGESSAAQIADLCGIARGHLFHWLKIVRTEGLEALLTRQKPGPREGACRGLDEAVLGELKEKLKTGEFVSAVQARRWLEEEHDIKRPYPTVWNWLKKLGGVLRVPRPSHSKKDPEAAQEFRDGLAEKLETLHLPEGTRIKLWMMDEARFGLHTQLRKLWTLKGTRPVVTRQIKYEWDYLYGSLDILSGQAHFCQLPTVSQHCDALYLEDLSKTDPDVIHVVIRDQAGFHLREGDPCLPARIRIIDLPPYNPELNPCEQLWDIVKDELGNRIYETIGALREAMEPCLKRWWEDGKSVLRLIGRDWLTVQANATHQKPESY